MKLLLALVSACTVIGIVAAMRKNGKDTDLNRPFLRGEASDSASSSQLPSEIFIKQAVGLLQQINHAGANAGEHSQLGAAYYVMGRSLVLCHAVLVEDGSDYFIISGKASDGFATRENKKNPSEQGQAMWALFGNAYYETMEMGQYDFDGVKVTLLKINRGQPKKYRDMLQSLNPQS